MPVPHSSCRRARHRSLEGGRVALDLLALARSDSRDPSQPRLAPEDQQPDCSPQNGPSDPLVLVRRLSASCQGQGQALRQHRRYRVFPQRLTPLRKLTETCLPWSDQLTMKKRKTDKDDGVQRQGKLPPQLAPLSRSSFRRRRLSSSLRPSPSLQSLRTSSPTSFRASSGSGTAASSHSLPPSSLPASRRGLTGAASSICRRSR